MAFKMKGVSLYKKTYDQAYKDRDMKTYGNLTKSEYIKEAKKQNISKTLTGSYNAPTTRVPGTIEKPVTIKQTATRRTTPKLPPKPKRGVNPEETKKQVRKTEGSTVRQLLRRTFGKNRPRKQK